MISSIKSDKADYLIKNIVDKSILDLNPIIAGGFALSIYRSIELHDNEDKFNYFKRLMEVNPKASGMPPFGDIDIWFDNDNDIHNENNNLNYLIQDDLSLKLQGGSFFQKFVIGDSEFFIKNTSKWANTFKGKSSAINSGVYQFVKTKHKTPPSLLSTFDFINCMVAWHDGVLYFDKRINDAFSKLELRLNNDAGYHKSSIASRVFNSLRAFKYAKRYSIDFDKELSFNIFNVYCDICNINYDDYNDKVVEIENLYGKKISSVKTLKDMVSALCYNFEQFSKMSSFDKKYAIFLIDQSDLIPGVKKYINSLQAPNDGVKNNVSLEINI